MFWEADFSSVTFCSRTCDLADDNGPTVTGCWIGNCLALKLLAVLIVYRLKSNLKRSPRSLYSSWSSLIDVDFMNFYILRVPVGKLFDSIILINKEIMQRRGCFLVGQSSTLSSLFNQFKIRY